MSEARSRHPTCKENHDAAGKARHPQIRHDYLFPRSTHKCKGGCTALTLQAQTVDPVRMAGWEQIPSQGQVQMAGRPGAYPRQKPSTKGRLGAHPQPKPGANSGRGANGRPGAIPGQGQVQTAGSANGRPGAGPRPRPGANGRQTRSKSLAKAKHKRLAGSKSPAKARCK